MIGTILPCRQRFDTRSAIIAPRSPVLAGVEWLGSRVPYHEAAVKGDTFATTWAEDGLLYTSCGDPCWGGKPGGDSGLDVEAISGEPPLWTIRKVNVMPGYLGSGGLGPKPTGMIAVDGALYLACQNWNGGSVPEVPRPLADIATETGHGWDAQIVVSRDRGATWNPAVAGGLTAMFPGRTFGAPAFINTGRGHAGAPDGWIYAISGEGWDNGNACRLGRVERECILSADAWEWVCGYHDDGRPQWSGELARAVPVLVHPGYLGTVEMVWLAGIERYLLLSWHHKVKASCDAGSELVIYDAPQPWGPFTLVHHEDPWEDAEVNPYNPRLPLAWFDQQRLEGWLLFSGSWRNGGSSPHYRAHARRFRLRRA